MRKTKKEEGENEHFHRNHNSGVIEMNKSEEKTLLELLGELPDHRVGNAIRHQLKDIIAIGILSILCNANTFVGMQLFGETHEKELREVLELPHGIPSHDVFGDVFSRLDTSALEQCFEEWIAGMCRAVKHIAVDGKTIRRSQSGEHKASHVITAYSSDAQLILGQLCTDEKSNEITAIPKLLKMLTLRGSTVTIDAIGTQKAIAEEIIEREGNYILALKENHPALLEDIRLYAQQEVLPRKTSELKARGSYAMSLEKGHGRIDKRECWMIPDLSWLEARRQWAGLSGAALIRSTRTLNDGSVATSERYYLYSQSELTAEEFLRLQRAHWSIENSLHWVLDVVFAEDDAHIRMGHAAVVLNMLRKMVLTLLKADSSVKGSLTSKRLRCAWDFSFALSVLGALRS